MTNSTNIDPPISINNRLRSINTKRSQKASDVRLFFNACIVFTPLTLIVLTLIIITDIQVLKLNILVALVLKVTYILLYLMLSMLINYLPQKQEMWHGHRLIMTLQHHIIDGMYTQPELLVVLV